MAYKSRVKLYQRPIFKVLVVQALVIACMACLFLLSVGLVAVYSAVLGGLIAFLPNVYFAIRVFRYFGARSAAAVTASLWSGEAIKSILTIIFFALVFLLIKPLDFVALFATYFMVLIISSLGLVLVNNNLAK